jgi:hypothetical protein
MRYFVLSLVLLLTSTLSAGEIVFHGSDYISSTAVLNGTSVRNHRLASGLYSGNLASRKSSSVSLAASFAALRYSRGWNTAEIELITSANTGLVNSSASADAWSSYPSGNGNFNWIYFYVNPTGQGEYFGKPITVTIDAWVDGYIPTPDGQAHNNFAIYAPSGLPLLQSHTTRGQSGSKSFVHSTTMGTWVAVAIRSRSYSTRRSMAMNTLRLKITSR